MHNNGESSSICKYMMSEYIVYRHICIVYCSRTRFYNYDVGSLVLLCIFKNVLLFVALCVRRIQPFISVCNAAKQLLTDDINYWFKLPESILINIQNKYYSNAVHLILMYTHIFMICDLKFSWQQICMWIVVC